MERPLHKKWETVFRFRSFLAYWLATGISEAGTALTTVVIPLIGATLLGLSPGQMSLLLGIGIVAPLLLQIVLGAWADSTHNRVRVVSGVDIGSGLAIAVVPVLWWAGGLTLWTLALVLAVTAMLGVGRSAFATPVVVSTVPPDRLVEANGVLNGTRSAMDVAGKGLGGLLLVMVAAPLALLADAVSFLIAGLLVTRVRVRRQGRQPVAAMASPPPSGRFSVAAIAQLSKNLTARADIWCLIGVAFVNGMTDAVFILYCVRVLNLEPALVAVLVGVGSVGGIAGGFLVGRIVARWGVPGTVLLGAAVSVCALAPLPFASQGATAVLAVTNWELSGAFGGTVVLAAVFGSVQSSAAAGTVARTMAVANNLLQLAALGGLAVGGLVGELASVDVAVVACAIGIAVLALPPALRGAHRRGTPDQTLRT